MYKFIYYSLIYFVMNGNEYKKYVILEEIDKINGDQGMCVYYWLVLRSWIEKTATIYFSRNILDDG